MGLTITKSYLSKYSLSLLILSCFLLIGFKPSASEGVLQSNESVNITSTTVPLLLNAGIVQEQEAELSIILWIENGTIPTEIWTQLPMSDWIWSIKKQQTKTGNVSATLTGHRTIDKYEESVIYTWYTRIAPALAKDGVQLYIDERVPEAIDISAYLSQSNSVPSQWSLLDNVVSIAGYQSNLVTSVKSGRDRINIQLLSRGQTTEGHTVLAIPALLKEF